MVNCMSQNQQNWNIDKNYSSCFRQIYSRFIGADNKIVSNTVQEPVLIHWILIGLEAILEKINLQAYPEKYCSYDGLA